MKKRAVIVLVCMSMFLLGACSSTKDVASNLTETQIRIINTQADKINETDISNVKGMVPAMNIHDWETYGEKIQVFYIIGHQNSINTDVEAIRYGCAEFIGDKTKYIAKLNGLTPTPTPTATPAPTVAAVSPTPVKVTEISSGQKQVYKDQLAKQLEDKNVSDISIATDAKSGNPIAYVQLTGTLPKESMVESELLDLCRIVAGRINECGIYQYNIELVDSNSQMAMTYNEQTE